MITPAEALRNGKRFTTTVNYTAGPYLYIPSFENFPLGILPFGWFTTQDGSVTAGQPDRAHEIYPVNTTRPTRRPTPSRGRPRGPTVAANGVLASRRTSGGRTLRRYEMDQPMASELVQVAVGQLDIIEQGSFRNVELRTSRRARSPPSPAFRPVCRTPASTWSS